MNDSQLDQLIRSSLRWEAARVAERQPTLHEASARVARRVGPSATRRWPVLMPAAAGGLNLLLIVLLLLALAAVTVGALLVLRLQPGPLPPPFGYATTCGMPFQTGDVASFGVQAGFRTLHSSGSLHSDPIIPDSPDGQNLSRTKLVESTAFLERRLAPLGVQLVRDRIAELGLATGCVVLHARDSRGAVYIRTPAGPAGVAWYPYDGMYGVLRWATSDEEEVLADLAADLSDLDAWLPDDAWIQPDERRVLPDQWLVFLTLTDQIRASSAYAEIELPGGVEPGAFGAELANDPIDLVGATESRCGVVDRTTALTVASSIDSARAAHWTGLLPAFPDGVDCEWLDAEPFGQPPPDPTPFIEGEFAHVDPCDWAPLAAELITTTPPKLVTGRDLGPFGTWDPLCEIQDSTVMTTRATVKVLSRSVSAAEARVIAMGLFGGSGGEEQILGHPAWISVCMASDRTCSRWGMAVSVEPYFLVFTEAGGVFTPETARAFAAAVVQSIEADPVRETR